MSAPVCEVAPAAPDQPSGFVPRYLNPAAAASYLSISFKQLEHMRRRGDGPRFLKMSKKMV
jgi:hypothetical protein